MFDVVAEELRKGFEQGDREPLDGEGLRLITHRVITLVKFPIFPVGILGAHYFTETVSQTVDRFDDVYSQLCRSC